MSDSKDNVLGSLIPISEYDLKSLIPTVGAADAKDTKDNRILPAITTSSTIPSMVTLTALPIDIKTSDAKGKNEGSIPVVKKKEPLIKPFPLGRGKGKTRDESWDEWSDAREKWYKDQAEKLGLGKKNKSKSISEQYVQRFFAGPSPPEVTQMEKELQQIRDKYGDFCVLLVKCGDDGGGTIAKVSPIEMALIPPFSFVVREESRKAVEKYIKPPLMLPKISLPSVLTGNISLEENADSILVIDSQSVESLGNRQSFLANNFPVANYIESLFTPYKTERLNILFEYEMKGLREAYLKKASRIATTLEVDESYTDEKKMSIIKRKESYIYTRVLKSTAGSLETILNRIITMQSQYKLVTPTMEESIFDWYASQLLYNSIPDQYKEIGPALLYHPGLVEYAKVIMGNLARLGVWKVEYFDYAMPALEIESFRVASIPKSYNDMPLDTPKDYFTIFDRGQMQSLGMFEYLDSGEINGNLNNFVGGVLDKLDFTKTCLTGSAIPVMFYFWPNKHSRYFGAYSPIFVYGNDVELKGRTLDFARSAVLTPGSNVPEAVFEFGADIDLAILTEDDKEFDAIAIKHFGVYSEKYPNLELKKNLRSKGYSYQILSTNAQGFRNVEIYKGTIAKILSHHVPMTRGWYDGKLHLDVTAIKVYK